MATQRAVPTRAGKYVTFQISRHYFAVEASRVRQVAPARGIVPLVHTLTCVRGVLLVRGKKVPVIDIRDRLGLEGRASHPQNSVILLDTGSVSVLPVFGIIADKMTDVIEFRDRDFRDRVIQQRNSGRPYGRPKTLLDVDSLLTEEERTSLTTIF